ncbi:MAG: hypothetical protein ABIR04_06270, partial [Cypionkella sp.]
MAAHAQSNHQNAPNRRSKKGRENLPSNCAKANTAFAAAKQIFARVTRQPNRRRHTPTPIIRAASGFHLGKNTPAEGIRPL